MDNVKYGLCIILFMGAFSALLWDIWSERKQSAAISAKIADIQLSIEYLRGEQTSINSKIKNITTSNVSMSYVRNDDQPSKLLNYFKQLQIAVTDLSNQQAIINRQVHELTSYRRTAEYSASVSDSSDAQAFLESDANELPWRMEEEVLAESVDPKWGPYAEREIFSRFQYVSQNVTADNVECRQKTCIVDLAFDDDDSWLIRRQIVDKLTPWNGNVTIIEAKDHQQLRFYLSR